LQLLNQRVLEDLKTTWWEFNRLKCPKIEDESDGISIQNIGGVFLVIFIGIGLGLITLAFEYYWYKWRPMFNKDSKNSEVVGHDNKGFDAKT
jgi:ionotropic glutamate receptor